MTAMSRPQASVLIALALALALAGCGDPVQDLESICHVGQRAGATGESAPGAEKMAEWLQAQVRSSAGKRTVRILAASAPKLWDKVLHDEASRLGYTGACPLLDSQERMNDLSRGLGLQEGRKR